MKDEIKEILDYISDRIIPNEKWNKVRDYITDLQQENERLKQPKIFIDTQDMEERYGEELYKDYLEKQVNDYKSRMNKAIEYVEKEIKDTKDNHTYFLIEPPCYIAIMEELLNILKGEDNESN